MLQLILTTAIALVLSQPTSQPARDASGSTKLGWELGTQAWTFRDRTAFEAIDTAHTLGLTCIELFSGQDLSKDMPGVKVGPDMTKEQREALEVHLTVASVRANSFGVVGFNTDEAAARKTFDFAKDMGMQTISAEPDPEAWDLVEKLADEYQINIATHDHPKPSRYWDPQIVLDAVKDRSKRLGACADTGHWTRSGLDNVECLKKLEGRVIELHFKDVTDDKDQPWGTGGGDASGVLAELKRQNFKGVILVEYETGAGAELEANVRKCIEWFDRTSAELAKEDPEEVTLDTLGQFLGRLHPIVVHFPIALLMVGAVVEVWGAIRKRPAPTPTGLVCLGFGAAGAATAAGMGWLNAAFEEAGNDSWVLLWHRWLGVTVASLSVLLLIAAWRAARVTGGGAVRVYRMGLVLAALLVSIGGHLGGMLTYGDTYLTDAVVALWKEPVPEMVPTAPGVAEVPAPIPSANGASIDFVSQVQPILAKNCYSCHGPGKVKGGLRLDSAEEAMKGGKSGPVIVPGEPGASELIYRVTTDDELERMPDRKPPLEAEQIEILRKWIAEGAHWAEGSGPTAAVEAIPEEEHWAYVAPARPEAPKVKRADWVRNPIDSFVAAQMEKEGLAPSPEADKAVLIRRVTLDLIGLPPTVAEVDAFLADENPEAYERVVDRLLASPRYGERWARPWLDLARYADSQGYEKDGPRTIWPWRDWVIGALNADMPFDEFTVEQIAGDMLPAPTQAQIIATGFHRNTMINEEGGVDPEEYRVNAVIDRANTTATVWLGATLGCAQCHDHKFDPFTQKEFYGFYAFFNSDSPEMHNDAAAYEEVSPKLRMRDPRDVELRRLVEEAEAAITPDLPADEATAKYAEADALRLRLHPDVQTLVMRRLDSPRETHVFTRGDFRNPADRVDPGVPAVFPPLPEGGSHDRAALARWLVSPANPLTARVTVNRMWEQHFGRGIVETCEDFGTRGTPPTHPELLDWLATEFVRVGWSQKAMHRLIVTSATYRQASNVSPAGLEADPLNKWLARGPRLRLEAEMVRDQALATGGILSAKIGGPSVFPVQPEGIWASPYSDNTWRTSEGEDLHRRSIYTYWRRSSPYPALITFDAPTRQLACTRRGRSDTPLQALTTLNDPVYVEAAAALAGRVLKEAGPDERARVEWAFRVCMARRASEDEVTRLVELYRQQAANFAADPGAAHELVSTALGGDAAPSETELAAWTVVANVLMNLDEFLTRG